MNFFGTSMSAGQDDETTWAEDEENPPEDAHLIRRTPRSDRLLSQDRLQIELPSLYLGEDQDEAEEEDDKKLQQPRPAKADLAMDRKTKILLAILIIDAIIFFLTSFAVGIRARARVHLNELTRIIEEGEYFNTTIPGIVQLNVTAEQQWKYDLHPVETQMIGTVYIRLCSEDIRVMRDILEGAHVIASHDDGWFYDRFSEMKNAYTRRSSHYSSVSQYGIPEGHLMKTLLTGQTRDSQTWFQLEGAEWSPFHNPADSVLHALNYIEYKVTGRQVGPLGTSRHTEWRPVVLVPGTTARQPRWPIESEKTTEEGGKS